LKVGDFTALNGHQWMIGEGFFHGGGRAVAVHRQGAARGHPVGVGGLHDEGS